MKNFVEQILIKFGSFHVIKMDLVPTVLSTSTPKYRWKFVYQPIFKKVKYRSADNVGGPMNRSVSSPGPLVNSFCLLFAQKNLIFVRIRGKTFFLAKIGKG